MSSEPLPGQWRPVSNEEFRRACGRFATGVTVATVLDAAGSPHGLTVSSFTSVSLNPPLALICLGHETSVLDAFRRAAFFGINVLSEHQEELSERFARKGADRFDGLLWTAGDTGVPLIPGALAGMEFRVHQRIISGDHDIFVGEMLRVRVNEGAPLLYYASGYRGIAAR